MALKSSALMTHKSKVLGMPFHGTLLKPNTTPLFEVYRKKVTATSKHCPLVYYVFSWKRSKIPFIAMGVIIFY